MSTGLFSAFPLVEYKDKLGVNITLRTRLKQYVSGDSFAFYPYTIEDGERPDTIAYDYYGDSNLSWLVLLANDIIDPYHEWPLGYNDFQSFIVSKYGSLTVAQGTILRYKKIQSVYFYNIQDGSIITQSSYNSLSGSDKNNWKSTTTVRDIFISTETYNELDGLITADYEPVYAYEAESELNDDKRNIQLLDTRYLDIVMRDLERLFVE